MEERKKKTFEKILNIYTILGLLFILTSILFVLIPISPYIIYKLHPSNTQEDIKKITANLGEYSQSEDISINSTKLPPLDDSLPKENYLIIDKISVYSPIISDDNYEEALKTGVWIVSNFGTPENNNKPIILAAHRFGYVYWDKQTRERISFYNLPKLQPGDIVKIIWNKRIYTYKIYKAEESVNISDYSADLILYTCKYFNSPQRIFRYAKRVIE